MNKSSIRKKILKLRKKNYSKNLSINPLNVLKYLKKKKFKSKIIGGYYPYNYELDILNTLKLLEKKKIYYLFTKNSQKQTNGFLSVVIKRPFKY